MSKNKIRECMISVSEGEIIDRLTILEIKQKEIHQEERLQLIKKEIELYRFIN